MDPFGLAAGVVVIGAGPAGSAAAITAAAAGLRVVVVEREPFPRPAPGESLHPGVQPLLARLGVEPAFLATGFPRFAGVRVRWNGPERFEPFGQDAAGPWLGFHAWRPTFDAILLDRARELGVRVLQPCQARGLTDGGLETDAGLIRAAVIVDATGRWRAVSRWLGLSWMTRGPARRVWYGYATGDRPAGRDDCPTLTGDRDGWTWVARVRPDTFAWVRVNLDNARPPDGWLPAELAGLAPVGPTCGADGTWQAAERPGGPGYFLVGDAAAVLDPASSHGVLRALMSGMMVGRLAAGQLAGRVTAEAAADHYRAWLHDWFDRDAARLEEFYAALT